MMSCVLFDVEHNRKECGVFCGWGAKELFSLGDLVVETGE